MRFVVGRRLIRGPHQHQQPLFEQPLGFLLCKCSSEVETAGFSVFELDSKKAVSSKIGSEDVLFKGRRDR